MLRRSVEQHRIAHTRQGLARRVHQIESRIPRTQGVARLKVTPRKINESRRAERTTYHRKGANHFGERCQPLFVRKRAARKSSRHPIPPWRPATPTIPKYRRPYRGLARSKPRGARSERRDGAAVSIADRNGQTIHEAEKKRGFRFRWRSRRSVPRCSRTAPFHVAIVPTARAGVRRRW